VPERWESVSKPVQSPDLSWASPTQLVSTEGWALEQVSHWKLVYRDGAITAEATTEDMWPQDAPSYALVWPPEFDETPELAALSTDERNRIVERIARGAREFHGKVKIWKPGPGWARTGKTTARCLEPGSGLEVDLRGNAVFVRDGVHEAEIPVLRADGGVIELAWSRRRLGGLDDRTAGAVSRGLAELGFHETIMNNSGDL
jgi:hypothetical protein